MRGVSPRRLPSLSTRLARHPTDHSWSAQDIDRVLHSERRVRPFLKRTQSVQIDTLPDGSYVMLDGRAWLVLGDAVWPWSAQRYVERAPRPSGIEVSLLTPPSIVAVLRAGYPPSLHPSCQ